jgi:subtilisin family serine protease
LQHVQLGEDLTNNQDAKTWANDLVGHGTHCTGVITARDSAGTALRGFVPDAEIHVLKIFPGGAFSNLMDALDYCIYHKMDVANMSLGSPQVSEAVEQKLAEAVESGVACVVASGNSGGAVHYPASSQYVLAVSALGKVGEFPQKTWETQQIRQDLLDQRTGLFFPQFTCYGPQIKVCAPGVAVISTTPGNDFDPESGTSMAAPHVTGFAALLLAHLPEFKRGGAFGTRNAQRVARLYQRIQSSSMPLTEYFGRERVLWTGAGLPTLHNVAREMQSATTQTTVVSPSEGAAVQPPQSLPAGTQTVQNGSPTAAPYPTLGSLLGAAIDNALMHRAYAAQFIQAQGGMAPFQAGLPITPQGALLDALGSALISALSGAPTAPGSAPPITGYSGGNLGRIPPWP